jgi:hypothetical protein
MQYLIYHEGKAFYTNWFDAENHYVTGMIVFDLLDDSFTTDGVNWNEIPEDHL